MRRVIAALLAMGVALGLTWVLAGCSKPEDPTEVIGEWVVDPGSLDNAAFNIVRGASERAGRNVPDAEIEPAAKELGEKLRSSPAEYMFAEDGTFRAVAGGGTANGTWTYTRNVLTLVSPTKEKPMRFRWKSGELTSVGDSPRHRNVRLVRK